MAMVALSKGAMMVVIGDDGDDLLPRRSHVPDLLRYQERADDRATAHVRSGKKVGEGVIRENIRKRVDVGAEIIVMKLACSQMTNGEWESFIGIKEGILFDPLPATILTYLPRGQNYRVAVPKTRTWHAVPPPAKNATAEQVARHYRYTEGSVVRMERQARRLLNSLRERAGLTWDVPNVPIWPAIMSDENLLAMLFEKA